MTVLFLALVANADDFTGKWLGAGGCSGVGCCERGDDDRTCLTWNTLSVYAADGSVTTLRVIQKAQGKEDRLWGLADQAGEEVVPPRYDALVPLVDGLAFGRRGEIATLIRDGVEVPSEVTDVELVQMNQGPPLAFVTLGDRARAVVRIDGTLGNRIDGVQQILKLGVGAAVLIANDGVAASILYDASGEAYFVGPEIAVYGESVAFGQPPSSMVGVVVGPGPLTHDPDHDRLVLPLDSSLRPLLVPGLVGVAPLGVTLDESGPSWSWHDPQRPRLVRGWLYVYEDDAGRVTYRAGDAERPDQGQSSIGSLAVLDQVLVLPETDQRYAAACVRDAASGAWVVWGMGSGHSGLSGRRVTQELVAELGRPTPDEAVEAYDAAIRAGNARRVAEAQAEADAEKARLAAAAEARRLRWEAEAPLRAAQAEEARKRAVDDAEWLFESLSMRAEVSFWDIPRYEEAAILLGPEYHERWLRRAPDVSPRFLAVVCPGPHCARAEEIHRSAEYARAEAAQKEAGLQALWRAVELGVQSYDPYAATQVNVQVYEGGRLVNKTMDYRAWDQIYGD